MFDSKRFLAALTTSPGVYQMLSEDGEVLYVGKAKNLKNRVSSYFRARGLNTKTVALVNRIASIEVTVVASETEALLLEQNLIKTHKPHFNILMRDDKSFPYIHISQHEYPRISYKRATRKQRGEYFGPYPNSQAARDALNLLQRVFKLRPCEDSTFNNRSRPCLQHQIDRCSAPCVNVVDQDDYQQSVAHAKIFLEGKSQQVMADLGHKMQQASTALAFEKAAVYRDQISALQKVGEGQDINADSIDVDVIGAAYTAGIYCVQVMMVRDSRVLGSRAYFPKPSLDEPLADVLSAFIANHYLGGNAYRCPPQLLLSETLDDVLPLEDALKQHHQRKVSILTNVRGRRSRWVAMAKNTAQQNCQSQLADRSNGLARNEALTQALDLDAAIERIECFDISHSHGEATVASCVVFDAFGPRKSDYRRFNIDGVTAGDDFAAMKQALHRRYSRLQAESATLPDVLVIDGGKGQLSQAQAVLDDLGISNMYLLGVAKGETRKSGFEQLLVGRDKHVLRLDTHSLGFHLLQHIRDEAHRFAVTGHKQRRDKVRRTSTLEAIPGVGPKKRKALLHFFGGLQEVKNAPLEEIAKVPGFSAKLARTVYDALRV